MTLELLMQNFTVCKVYSLPPELLAEEFFFVGKTDRELSLLCRTEAAPAETVAREDGWRALRVEGTMDFSLVGILAELSGILAEAGVSIFAVSTYDTDYILVKEQQRKTAIDTLAARGIPVSIPAGDTFCNISTENVTGKQLQSEVQSCKINQ